MSTLLTTLKFQVCGNQEQFQNQKPIMKVTYKELFYYNFIFILFER